MWSKFIVKANQSAGQFSMLTVVKQLCCNSLQHPILPNCVLRITHGLVVTVNIEHIGWNDNYRYPL